MKVIDLNADIGEAEDAEGIAAELEILRHVTSVNIACGGHRGDEASMRRVIKEARRRGVKIGAHPAYPDRENFGRRSMRLGPDIEAGALAQSLTTQILSLIDIAKQEGADVTYIKPHGALYNDAVQSRPHAELIADVICKIDPSLVLLGAPQSHMGAAAQRHGLRFVTEGFIDRRYTDDGHLQSRKIEGAVIADFETRMAQACSLVTTGEVETASGNTIELRCESLCLHGDSQGAVDTAKKARAAIEEVGVTVQPFSSAANMNAAHEIAAND